MTAVEVLPGLTTVHPDFPVLGGGENGRLVDTNRLRGYVRLYHADVTCSFARQAAVDMEPTNPALPPEACRYCNYDRRTDQMRPTRTDWDGTEGNTGRRYQAPVRRRARRAAPVYERPVAARPSEVTVPVPRGPSPGDGELLAATAAWLADLDRLVQESDVTLSLERAAALWLRNYTGTFEFLWDMQRRERRMTRRMVRGVLNCWRREAQAAAGSTRTPPPLVESLPPQVADLLP